MVDQLRSSILRRVDHLGSTSLSYTLNWVQPVCLEKRVILPSKPAKHPSLVLTMVVLAMMVATMEVLMVVLAMVVATMEVLMVVLAMVMITITVVVATMVTTMVGVLPTTIATTNKMVTLAQTSTRYLQDWETS